MAVVVKRHNVFLETQWVLIGLLFGGINYFYLHTQMLWQ